MAGNKLVAASGNVYSEKLFRPHFMSIQRFLGIFRNWLSTASAEILKNMRVLFLLLQHVKVSQNKSVATAEYQILHDS
jgi:hypothetical protein